MNIKNKEIFEIFEFMYQEYLMITDENAKLGYLDAISDVILNLINYQEGEKNGTQSTN